MNLNVLKFVIFLIIILGSCKKEELPQLTTYEISGVTVNSAVGGGNISSDGGAAIISRGVCWSKNPEPRITDNITIDGNEQGSFISKLTLLSPGTKYYLRAYATNSVGTQYGEEISFTTLGSLPQASDLTASDLTITSAVLHGIVNPGNLQTDVCFQYGLTTDYENTIPSSGSQLIGNNGVSLSITLSNLKPGTIYHYRIKTTNELGNTYSEDQTFKTPGEKPSYTDLWVKNAGTNIINIGISMNPHALPTTVTIEYGTTEAYSNSIVSTPVTGNSSINLDLQLNNLLLGTKYYYRVKLENLIGITYTDGRTYKTYNAVDADNNGYYSVVIGTQEWLSSNLKTTHFSNGDAIPLVSSAFDWSALTSPGYVPCKNDPSFVYGFLYNFFVASDARNVCPSGWHVPTLDQFNSMIDYLGGIIEADTKIREQGQIHWVFSTGATNSSGLTILPAGARESYGDLGGTGLSAHLWTSSLSTLPGSSGSMNIGMDWDRPKIYINPYGKQYGSSIRCIKN